MMYSMKGKLENLSSLDVLKKKKKKNNNGIKFLISKKSKRLKDALICMGMTKIIIGTEVEES